MSARLIYQSPINALNLQLVDLVKEINKLVPAGTYADNAAATAAKVPLGQAYMTATGAVMIRI